MLLITKSPRRFQACPVEEVNAVHIKTCTPFNVLLTLSTDSQCDLCAVSCLKLFVSFRRCAHFSFYTFLPQGKEDRLRSAFSPPGEFFDGRNCYFYQDLFRYNIDKKQWHTIYSPNSPGPRSAHAMVASPADGGKLWLFGGEFASMNQTTFHHYRDLWSFDIKSQTWERFDTRIRPSARSGHRMALYKNFLVLFGGFHDSGSELEKSLYTLQGILDRADPYASCVPTVRTTYLSDLWLFDLNEYRWYEVQQRPVDPKPRARSGFSMMPCPEGIVLHGGYCKEYTQGKTAKGIPLEDTWLLRLDQVKLGIQFSSSDAKWEKKRKVGGFSPSLRSGTTMATWTLRGMGIMFGGVFDDEADEEHMTSVFYNDLVCHIFFCQRAYLFQSRRPGAHVTYTVRL